MEKTAKRSGFFIIGMILVAALVLGGLCVFFWRAAHRGEIYAKKAAEAVSAQDWDSAYRFAEQADRNGADGMQKLVTYEQAEALFLRGAYAEARTLFSGLKGYREADERTLACTYGLAEEAERRGEWIAARDGFLSAAGYRDALSRADGCRYAVAEQQWKDGDPESAFWGFFELGEYRDAAQRAADVAVVLTGEPDAEKALLFAQGYQPETLAEQMQLSDLRHSFAGRRVAAGHAHAVTLTDSGRVRFAGDASLGKAETETWTDIIAVAAGYAHTLGLRSDGRVVAAGDDSCGQCEVEGWTDVKEIACGPFDSYALRSDGTILHCGYLADHTVISGWTDVVSLGAGEGVLYAVRRNGTLLVSPGESAPDWHNLCAVSAAGYFPVGLRADGTVCSDVRDLSDWTDIYAIDGSATLLVGLKADGTLLCLPLAPVSDALLDALAAETDVVGMSVAGTYVLLLHTDGSVSAPGAPFDCSALQH